jgi:SNF2 family DNA or RNA helicase
MIMKNSACGLFLEMGLGKTVISLTAAERLIYHEFEVSRVLVIAPLKVAEDTWSRESEKWDHLQDLKIVRILGNLDKRLAAAKDDADIYVINRENVVWLAEMYPGKYWKWDMVIIDELSSFKSSSTMRFKAMRSVRPYIDRIVGLTGTPNPNGYMDLWAQIFLLDQGKRLERTIGGYRQKYFRPGRGNGHITYEWLLLPGADKAIQEKISDIAVSMKAEDYLKLPDRIENEILVTLPPDTLKRYRELEKEHLLELQDPDATITAANAAAVMNKLLQLTGGAVYDDEGGFKVFHDEKIKALKDIIDTAGGPVLVFYGYRHERDRLQKDLTKLKPRELQKEKDIDDWNAGKVKVLIAHPASVGYGLNLQAGGHVIVWYSIPWSLELYQQANARLHRQGQTETVVINHLVAVGTVDKQVMAALKKKDMSQSALMTALKERINENW